MDGASARGFLHAPDPHPVSRAPPLQEAGSHDTPRSMRIIRDITRVQPHDRGATAAIGNFDGVHVGHQAVLGVAAKAADAPLGVLTFEPHPREFFAPSAPPFRLMNAAARAHRLQSLGVELLCEMPFNGRLASLSPEAFSSEIIRNCLGLVHVTVGADFRFGKGRAGNAKTLEAHGEEMGFGVTIAELVAENGDEVSSSRVRKALSDGRPEDAAAMLGHLHRIEGAVLHGHRRGRELGYPTANVAMEGLHPPRFGVYAVKADVLDGSAKGGYEGVASLGVRPMFGDNVPNLEVHLFDFSGDLYGASLSVALVRYLRPERRFKGLDALVAAMDDDSARARSLLAEMKNEQIHA